MRLPSWNKIFVAFLESLRLAVNGQLHFAVDNHSPLRVDVAVRGHVCTILKLEKDKLG